jgi:hypothetical protein
MYEVFLLIIFGGMIPIRSYVNVLFGTQHLSALGSQVRSSLYISSASINYQRLTTFPRLDMLSRLRSSDHMLLLSLFGSSLLTIWSLYHGIFLLPLLLLYCWHAWHKAYHQCTG